MRLTVAPATHVAPVARAITGKAHRPASFAGQSGAVSRGAVVVPDDQDMDAAAGRPAAASYPLAGTSVKRFSRVPGPCATQEKHEI